jgi:hypothetical protein
VDNSQQWIRLWEANRLKPVECRCDEPSQILDGVNHAAEAAE